MFEAPSYAYNVIPVKEKGAVRRLSRLQIINLRLRHSFTFSKITTLKGG